MILLSAKDHNYVIKDTLKKIPERFCSGAAKADAIKINPSNIIVFISRSKVPAEIKDNTSNFCRKSVDIKNIFSVSLKMLKHNRRAK